MSVDVSKTIKYFRPTLPAIKIAMDYPLIQKQFSEDYVRCGRLTRQTVLGEYRKLKTT